jgi:hypothetical protein
MSLELEYKFRKTGALVFFLSSNRSKGCLREGEGEQMGEGEERERGRGKGRGRERKRKRITEAII